MTLFRSPQSNRRRPSRRPQLKLETLETRLAPYAATGNAWPHPELITISFVPDGTVVGNGVNGPITSNLFATFNTKFGTPSVWQTQILKAAQAWGLYAGVNFSVVSDSGADAGSGSYQQGDSTFGDIRISGYNFNTTTLAQASMPPPVNNYSIAGDVSFNTGQTFNISTTYDLYTVAMHEIGHSLGLGHSTDTNASMYSTYNAIKVGPDADDVSGIRSIYGARVNDAYDAAGSNGTMATASNVTSAINPGTGVALLTGLDLTTTSDVDYYKFTAPSGSSQLKLVVQSQGLSLLAPLTRVYNSSGTLLGGASSSTDGATLNLTVNVTPGSTYYVMVDGYDNTAFGTGAYAMSLNLGSGSNPTISPPNTQTANGDPLTSGGGLADYPGEFQANAPAPGNATAPKTATAEDGSYVVVWANAGGDGSGKGILAQRFDANGIAQGEFQVNTTTQGAQDNPAVAMSPDGGFVVVWESKNQDGSRRGIFGQLFAADGSKVGGEFQVNTTNTGNQFAPEVAMNASGAFVVTWTSSGQDGSGNGVYEQRFSTSGSKQGTELRVNTTTAGDQDSSSVGIAGDGSFVIAWESSGQDGSGDGVYAQRFSSSGSKQGTEFRVNTTTANDQQAPSVGMTDDGSFDVAWQGKRSGTGWEVFAQRYNSDGSALGGEFVVNSTTAGDQIAPVVAAYGHGDFIVTWQSQNLDGSGWGIAAQNIASSGLKFGGEFVVNTTTANDQVTPAVATNDDGDFVIVWASKDSGSWDVRGQAYHPPGDALEVGDVANQSSGKAADTTSAATVRPGAAAFPSIGIITRLEAPLNVVGAGGGSSGREIVTVLVAAPAGVQAPVRGVTQVVTPATIDGRVLVHVLPGGNDAHGQQASRDGSPYWTLSDDSVMTQSAPGTAVEGLEAALGAGDVSRTVLADACFASDRVQDFGSVSAEEPGEESGEFGATDAATSGLVAALVCGLIVEERKETAIRS